jgi:hypothetical protein
MLTILTEEHEVLFRQGNLSSGGSNWISSFVAQEFTYKIERNCRLTLLGNKTIIIDKSGICYAICNSILG